MGPPTLSIGVPAQIQKPRIAKPPHPLFASVLRAHPIYRVLDLYLQELENGNKIEGVPLKKQQLVQNRVEKNSAKNFMKAKYLEKSFTRTLSFERQQEYAKLHELKKQKEKQEKI